MGDRSGSSIIRFTSPALNIFTAGGRLQRERFPSICAVAVLSAINPTAIGLEQRIDKRLDDDAELVDVVRVARDEYARPDYDPNAYEGRLDTFHNMFAAEPEYSAGSSRDLGIVSSTSKDTNTPMYRGPRFAGSPYMRDIRPSSPDRYRCADLYAPAQSSG